MYRGYNLAFLFNHLHGFDIDPRVFRCEGEIVVENYCEAAVFGLEVQEEIEVPGWFQSPLENEIQVRFAARCALSVLPLWSKYGNVKTLMDDPVSAAKKALDDGEESAYWSAVSVANTAFADLAKHLNNGTGVRHHAAQSARGAWVANGGIDLCKLADESVT